MGVLVGDLGVEVAGDFGDGAGYVLDVGFESEAGVELAFGGAGLERTLELVETLALVLDDFGERLEGEADDVVDVFPLLLGLGRIAARGTERRSSTMAVL